MRQRLAAVLAAVTLMACQAAGAAPGADFRDESPSLPARHVADWVLDARDHEGRPFVIVDKRLSRVFVFDGTGTLLGAAPALLGLARGDHSVPGIGQRAMSAILPEERTTPSGRFVASLGPTLKGGEILWVDYDTAIALHPVVLVANERRLQRLASLVPGDRRITFGCINVPEQFFHAVVAPLFRGGTGVVYVLPESRSASEVFGSYEIPPVTRGEHVPSRAPR